MKQPPYIHSKVNCELHKQNTHARTHAARKHTHTHPASVYIAADIPDTDIHQAASEPAHYVQLQQLLLSHPTRETH